MALFWGGGGGGERPRAGTKNNIYTTKFGTYL